MELGKSFEAELLEVSPPKGGMSRIKVKFDSGTPEEPNLREVTLEIPMIDQEFSLLRVMGLGKKGTKIMVNCGNKGAGSVRRVVCPSDPQRYRDVSEARAPKQTKVPEPSASTSRIEEEGEI